MKKGIIFTIIVLFIIIGCFVTYNILLNSNYNQIINKIEINTEVHLNDLVNINIVNDKIIDTSKLGTYHETIEFNNKYNIKISKRIKYSIIDTIKPEIKGVKNLSIGAGGNIDLLKDIVVEDNSLENIAPSIIGEYDLNNIGEYKLQYKAIDSSNNETLVDFILKVNKKVVNKVDSSYSNDYYIKINKTKNVVMVYGKDNDYSTLVKTFVCSAGTNTPLGSFKTSKGYEWGSVVGGVYARYSTRIYGGILFHSVPYYTKNKGDMESEEYNKLGNIASAGCIRLSVIDSKWIFDNIDEGTIVEIYESDELPDGVVKPDAIKIDLTSPNKGWDPTDPDENNPWNIN